MSKTRLRWLFGLLLLVLVLAYLAPSEVPSAETDTSLVRPRVGQEHAVTRNVDDRVMDIRPRHAASNSEWPHLFGGSVHEAPSQVVVIAPTPVPAAAQPIADVVPPPRPILPVVFGRYDNDGAVSLFVMHAGRNWVVREGDRIGEDYEVKHIDGRNAVLLYLPNHEHQTITFAEP